MEKQEGAKKKNKWVKWAVLGLVCANFFAWLMVLDNAGPEKYLEATFFDVGQGDAAFVQAPNGVQIIIDGGPNDSILEKLGRAMPFYDRDIDWVILSHPDRDHVDGLLAVLKNYNIHNIIWSGIPKETAESSAWVDAVAKEGANVVVAAPGEKFVLAGSPELILEILAPVGANGSDKSSNDASVIAKLVYGQRSFLFTGDATAKEERSIFAVNPETADILKVAHHGSKTSADDTFFAELLPAAAVIPVGATNPYGHPNAETLDLLAKYDIKTLRTDESGDIVFRTDGESIFVSTQK